MSDQPSDTASGNMRWWLRLMEVEDRLAATHLAFNELLETNVRLWEQNTVIQKKADSLKLLEEGALHRMKTTELAMQVLERRVKILEARLGLMQEVSEQTMKCLEETFPSPKSPKGHVDDYGIYHPFRHTVPEDYTDPDRWRGAQHAPLIVGGLPPNWSPLIVGGDTLPDWCGFHKSELPCEHNGGVLCADGKYRW